jgi:hypothetical protein
MLTAAWLFRIARAGLTDNSTGFVAGNLGGGGQWETMQTLSFQSVFEFVDRDRNGHYTPGVDTIVSRVDLRSLVWDRPCSSNLTSFPGAGAPGDRYAAWNLASLPIDDVAQGLRVVVLLESGSGAAGVLGPSDDLSAGAQVLLLSARNVRFVLSLQDYSFTRNDTFLALNATLLHARQAADSAIRPSNIDLSGASGVGGSALPRPIRLSDVNVLSSAGVEDPHTHAPARFDEAYVAWNPSWATLLPRHDDDDDDDAAFQSSNVTDRLWMNVTLSQLVALQSGDGTAAMGPDAAGMFFGNYTTRDANGSDASSTAVQHAKVAVSFFILSFASGPRSASAASTSLLRRSLNVSFSLGLGSVPLPGTARPAPAPPKSKLVWILVGAAGGVLLFLTVVWIFCRTKKKKQHPHDVAANSSRGHSGMPVDDLEHSDLHYQTLVNEEYEGVAAGGMNAHAYSPFSPPSAVSSTSGLSGGEDQSIPSSLAAALSPSHHRHVRSPSSGGGGGGAVGSPRRVAGRSLSFFSSASERERRAEALMIRGGAGPANSVGQRWGGAGVLSSASAASRHSSPSPVSNVPPPQSLAREQPAAPTHLL